MPRIQTVEYENANEEVKAQFDDQISRNGRITNMKKTLLHSLPAFHALMEWYPLRDSAKEFLSDREVNLFCHAISSQNSCLICSTFFRKILIDSGENPDNPVFSKREEVLIEFGRRCVTEPLNIDNKLFSQLKEFFNDQQIVLLTAFAGMMIATNLINNALKVDLDDYLESYTGR